MEHISIINLTGVPTDILLPLIVEAASVLPPIRCVTIKFTRGRRLRAVAYDNDLIKVVLPYTNKYGLSPYWKAHPHRHTALLIYLILVHEFQHVHDFQTEAKDMCCLGPLAERPYEQRAYKAEQKGLQTMPAFLTLPLAIWLENNS